MRLTFKRRRPQHRAEQPKVSIEDLIVLRWYGFHIDEWCDLPAIVKADKREGYFQAKGLGA